MRRVNTLLRRIALPFGFAVALAALLLMVSPASAQEPPEAESGARLHPGINLIGWVGEPTPVAQLFREIPQLEAIWAWDAELDDWIVAARNAPEWLGGLGRVTAGMGLRMQLGGDAPVIWDRSTEPTRGLVKLRTGWNLVAWSGADGAAIDDVAKGIGWSLRSVRRWDAVTQQWATWTSPERSAQVIADTSGGEEAEFPGVRRGEALWVKVSRSVNWLQPTDILPRLVFPGGASQSLQARVREDLEAVLSYFGTRYGIQADPDFTVYVAKNVDVLIQAYKDDGRDVSDAYDASIRALWNSGVAWAGGDITFPQHDGWGESMISGISISRAVFIHEYFHVLQSQLSDGRATQWLVEGTAYWAEIEYAVPNGFDRWDIFTIDYRRAFTGTAPTLRSTENSNFGWEYILGWLAAVRLATDAGPDSWLEFWRQLASTEIGLHGRWTSSPDWRTTLQNVFDVSVSDFYAEFNAWQREQALINASAATSSDPEARWIRGRLIDASGDPVARAFVNAIAVAREPHGAWTQRVESGADGSFAVSVPEQGAYRLWIDLGDGCTRYYHGSDGPTTESDDALLIDVVGADIRDVNLQLPDRVCGWQIRGRVVDSDGEPLAGASVSACGTDGNCTWGERTESDEAFAVTAAKPGDYRLRLDLVDGCSVYYSRSGPTFERNDASLITVADADVDGIVMRVSTDICHLRVGGSIGGIERFLDGYVRVNLCQVVENWCRSTTSRYTENDGPFVVAVPVAGAYRLTYNLDGCAIHYGLTGLTSNTADAALIHIGERDMRVGYRQIPADVCAYQIKGSITTSNGQPLADTYIWACREVEDECVDSTGRWTDRTGTFAITVPVEGDYRLRFRLEGCEIYFSSGGLTTTFDERFPVRIEGRSVRVDPRQIPSEMCAHRISGRFLDASGAPLSEMWINAAGPSGVDGVRTDASGLFKIRVPTDGEYRFGIQLRDQPRCWHWLEGKVLGSPDRPVRVSGADVTGVVLRLPDTIENLCE